MIQIFNLIQMFLVIRRTLRPKIVIGFRFGFFDGSKQKNDHFEAWITYFSKNDPDLKLDSNVSHY